VRVTSAPTVAEIVSTRKITEILHFTTNRGFLGSLAAGLLLPRSKLESEQILRHIIFKNAPHRSEEDEDFDKTENWIDYVNMSISAINAAMLAYSERWHAGKDISWFVMAFDPVILEHYGVYFSTTNNIYPFTRRATGGGGLDALFASFVPRKSGWSASRGRRPPHLTTCQQAEVLYPKGVPMAHLRAVYTREEGDGDWVHAMLATYNRSDVSVLHDPAKFVGFPN
jgi:hypothetical protein